MANEIWRPEDFAGAIRGNVGLIRFSHSHVTAEQQHSVSAQMQRIASDISARLSQIAKDPPDLAGYLRIHAECIVQSLQPVGLIYQMANGQGFQPAYAINYESLRLREHPAQENAFQRATRTTANQARPVFLDVQSSNPEFLRGLAVEDAPAPESLPLQNQTPFQHAFAPIPLSKKVVGVLHAWFAPGDSTTAQARTKLIAHGAAEIELYLKARRISDISQELTRINTYAHFLEDVAGDEDLESVAWKLVNYAREAIGCDRVCLLVDARYGQTAASGKGLTEKLALQACSGLRRPHPHSEHAEILKAHALELLKMTIVPPASPTGANAAAPGSPPAATDAPAKPAPAKSSDERPQMRIVFTHRDPSKTATRPDVVNHYFETIPMNWSTVLPLYDRKGVVCGTLLFEGQHSDEKTGTLFGQMRDLAVSGGRALATALIWHRRKTLRLARVLMKWHDQLLATPRRRIAIRYGLPAALFVGLMATPMPYRVAGDATMRPASVQTIAALTSGRLLEVNAREGDRVTKGQVLCVLDSSDLQLQLRQAEQERERALTEASLAIHQDRSELRMQIARLSAEKAQTLAAKIRRDIEQTIIRAPFDGVLIGPQDFAQRRGQMIGTGESVAEVADPSKWEVKVSVREQDVTTLVREVKRLQATDADKGVPGQLTLSSHPNRVFNVELNRPEGFANRLDTSGGKYNFSTVLPVAGEMANSGEPVELGLKAGYTGRVKFRCGYRPLISILFGDFVRFLRVNVF